MLKIHYHIPVLALALMGGVGFSAQEASALPVDHYAQSSRMAQGKWVKIRVKEDGMQFVSNDQLKKMGFSSPSQVRVYGYGGRRLPQTLNASTVDDLPLQPCLRTADGIAFFGTGTVNWLLKNGTVTHEQNPYSTSSYYFLSDAPLREGETEEPEPLKTAYGSDDPRVSSATQYLLHESELVSAGESGSDLFGEDFRTTATRTFTFDVPGAVNEDVDFNVAFAAKAGGGATVTYSIGDDEIGTTSISASVSGSIYTAINCTRLEGYQSEPGKSALTVRFAGTGVVTNALLDFIECSYERALGKTKGEPLLFHCDVKDGSHPVFSVAGVESGTLIWDVSDPAAPVPLSYDLEGDTALFAPAGAGLRRYVVFTSGDTFLPTETSGSVGNQDLHALETPQMLIISPKEYKSQADKVAQLHAETDGMKVYVLTPEEIYNEFSSGAPDVTAFRKLMKMWYDRSAGLPEDSRFGYCLLMGRATYDQRKLTDALRNSSYPRVLTWESNVNHQSGRPILTDENSYVSDNYIAMLKDCDTFNMSEGKLCVGVGRMPVKSVSEARILVDKLIKYVKTPDYGSWRNNVLILADDGDNAVHANQSQDMYSRMLDNGGGHNLYERMYIDAYEYGTGSYKQTYPQAKTRMLKLIDEGLALWTYIGHANPTSLTAEDMWNYTDLTSMTNKRWPVFYTASCEFLRFDSDAVSGCESMWLHPDAGIIAAIAANRKVYVMPNGNVSNALGRNYFRRGSDNLPRRLGRVYMDVINDVGNDDNKHRFALMGDPAMRVALPSYQVKVENLAGVEIDYVADAADYPVVPGLSKMKVTGSVLNQDGTPATDFNGSVVPVLYDAEIVVTTNGHTTNADKTDGKVISYNDRKNRLFTGNFPVKNGKWEATLLLPEEIENNFTQARITFHAAPEADSTLPDAIGSTDRFYVYGWDDVEEEDTKAPEIQYMYLNNSAFRPGVAVGPDPVFKAKVRDESGINISTSGVGRMLTVIVDSEKVFSNLADYFVTEANDPSSGTISYPLTGLVEGEHELEFLVWDNAGNSTRGSFAFRIAPQSEIPDLDIYTDASPAISSVTFYINSDEAVRGLVEVFDLSGRRVWFSEAPHNDGALSVKWNLSDAGGSRVPRGIYLYRATVTDATGKERRATKKFAVGNP